MNVYGYIKFDGNKDKYQSYLNLLKGYGLKEHSIFTDDVEEKDKSSVEGHNLPCQCGDLLLVPSLDCLGGSYQQILQSWRYLIYDRQLELRILDLPALDTQLYQDVSQRIKLLDLVGQLLCFVSQKEEEQQTIEHTTSSLTGKSTDKKSGRKPLPYPDQWNEIYELWQSGVVTARQAMERSNLKYASFYNLVKRYEEANQIVRRRIHGKEISNH